ncbi:MAG: phosphocholine cytidylyltransferase family protein [Bacteroidota bacterium]|nr:phosphocholine cytidylyltransferase family protein [Bacteroidota bacterium]
MYCIILAAGTSSRLRPLTDTTPKCLLPVGRQTIIERALRSVFHSGIIHFTVVVGFQQWMIVNFVKKNFPSLTIEFVENKDYASTNNAHSLLLALRHVLKGLPGKGQPILLLDGDVLFETGIVRLLKKSHHPNCLAVRTKGEIGGEDIKVSVDEHLRITHIGKEVPLSAAFGESVGIEKFSTEGARALLEILERRAASGTGKNEFYEASFQEMIERGQLIHAIDAGERRCIEVDTPDDLHRAEMLFP